jgi:hypothetical protein
LFDLVQERGLACARLTCEKNILACIAHVFECEVELGIGDEAHVKFAMYGLAGDFAQAVEFQNDQFRRGLVNRLLQFARNANHFFVNLDVGSAHTGMIIANHR